jgi:thiamine-phosphate pyrophosphorylase
MRGLYAIVDVGALAGRLSPTPAGTLRAPPGDVWAFAEAVLDARPAALQLRDKRGSAGEMLELLCGLAPLAARAGVPLFANDRPDLAALAACDGVHLGRQDVPATVARSVANRSHRLLQVGLSTHDAAELDAALSEAPDYVAIGPVFATTNKHRPAPVLGLAGLEALAQRARAARPDVVRVAIGGISLEEAAAVADICEAVAVIGALLPRPALDGAVPSRAAALDAVRDRARALAAAIHTPRARNC